MSSKLLEDIYRGYRIKVAGEDIWIAKITHIVTGQDAPLRVTAAREDPPEHCRDIARRQLDRYIAFLGNRDESQ